jgi:hypothetical protein
MEDEEMWDVDEEGLRYLNEAFGPGCENHDGLNGCCHYCWFDCGLFYSKLGSV